MENKQYFIHDGKERKGPFTFKEIEQMGLDGQTPIWYTGLEDWTTVSKILPPGSVPPPLKNKPNPIQQKPKSNKLALFIGIALPLAVLFFWLNSPSDSYESSTYVAPVKKKEIIRDHEEDKRKAYFKMNAVKYLNPHTNDYKRNLLTGGIWDLQIKIDNNTPYKIDYVEVVVQYLSPQKDVVKQEIIQFRDLIPGKRQYADAPRSTRGVEVICYARNMKSKQMGT